MDEVPLLWFSANQRWEPTATKMIRTPQGMRRMTFGEQLAQFGCIRFTLGAGDPRLMAWEVACRAAGTSRDSRRALERVGKRCGANSADWFAVAGSVPIVELTLSIFGDKFGDKSWHPADPTEMAQVWTEARGPGS